MSEPASGGANGAMHNAESETTGKTRGPWGWLGAVLRLRCPRCRTGRLFRGLLTMNDPCPVCGLIFEREEGYFLGAMYFSYTLSSLLMVTFYFTTAALFPDWGGTVLALVAVAAYVPFVPVVFRYSRALWISFDRSAWPSEVSAGMYEKLRLKELAEQRVGPLARRRIDPPGARGLDGDLHE